MKMTVKSCLELDAFKPSIVAAGKTNLENAVKTVSVMDAADVKTAVSNNGVSDQLVLTSFYGMKDDIKAKVSAVKELAANGVSGIVLFNSKGKVTEEIAPMVEAAEKAGLPFIVLATGNTSKYSDAITQIMDKLLIGSEMVTDLIHNTIYHLMDFDKHRTFPDALKTAALKNDFQVVLISKDFNPILIAENRHRVSVAEAVRKLQKRNTSDDRGIYSILDVEGIAAFWGSVTISDEEYFLLIVDNEEQYSAIEITRLAEIIKLAMGLWKYTPVRDVKAELIKALMRGNKSLAYSVHDEMNLGNLSANSVFYGRGLEGKLFTEIAEDFEERRCGEIFSITEGDETYGLILSTTDSSSGSSGKGDYLKFFDAIKEISKDVKLFHVTGINGLEAAADGFNLINETQAFMESVFPYKRVFSKYELVLVSNCINIQLQGGRIKKNYVSLLEPFVKEMGENKAKQLLDTLETFVLDAGMNSNNTSKFMGIHTNTVQYRLKRINEVLGVEITGNRVIPGLTIALALQRLERVVRE